MMTNTSGSISEHQFVPYRCAIHFYRDGADTADGVHTLDVYGPPNASDEQRQAIAQRAVAKLENNSDTWPFRFVVTVREADVWTTPTP